MKAVALKLLAAAGALVLGWLLVTLAFLSAA
jgi:hypothetical protein